MILEKPEERIENYLLVEINSALTKGGLIAFALGLMNFIVLFILNSLKLVQNLWLPCIFALIACLYSLLIFLFARKNAIHGPCFYKIFIPFMLLPTAFFVASSFIMPAGAASYITGPFSYLYFILIVITGFLFKPRLAYLAGILAGAGYFLAYLMAAAQLNIIIHPDPVLRQDLTDPALYVFKSMMMVFCGFFVGTLSRISRKLILRVMKEEEEKILITNTFGMIVDPRVRDRMIQGNIELGGETRVITVLFADIRGFTTFSQTMTPKELLNFMKEFFDVMNEQIKVGDGTVIEYVGDEIMALFGAPLPLNDHAVKACSAALLMQKALGAQREIWKEKGKPLVQAGIGIHTGTMLVGNIGSTERYKYGAIGDNVNIGSRLQGLTKEYGVPVIVSEDTINELNGRFRMRELDCVKVRGRTSEIRIYQIIDFIEKELPEEWKQLIDHYEQALHFYYDNDTARALELFRECLKTMPGDRPSEVFVDRLEHPESTDVDV